jgi:hypothetical protein
VRWTCVREGLTLLEEGLEHNPHGDDLAEQTLADIRLKGRIYTTRLPAWIDANVSPPRGEYAEQIAVIDRQAARVRERLAAMPQWVRDEVFFHLDCLQNEPFVIADRYADPDDPSSAFVLAVRDDLAWHWLYRSHRDYLNYLKAREAGTVPEAVDPLIAFFPEVEALQARIEVLGWQSLNPEDQPDPVIRARLEEVLADRRALIDRIIDAFPFDKNLTDEMPGHDARRYARADDLTPDRIREFRQQGRNRFGGTVPGYLWARRDQLSNDLKALRLRFSHDAVAADLPAVNRLIDRRTAQLEAIGTLERTLAQLADRERVATDAGDTAAAEALAGELRAAIATYAAAAADEERALASGARLAIDACSIAGLQWGLRDVVAHPARGAFVLLAALAPAIDALTASEDPEMVRALELVGPIVFQQLDRLPGRLRAPTRVYEAERRRRWAEALAQRPERK